MLNEKSYELGKIGDLEIRASPSALAGALAMWAGFVGFGKIILGLPTKAALLGSAAATGLHLLSDLVHNLGHAWAARQTGYPMKAIRFWLVLAQSDYPRNEPELPPETHIRRALGGPIASACFAVIAYMVLRLLPQEWVTARWVARYVAFENAAIFAGQVVVPMGFNDGTTILENIRKID